MSPTPPSVFVGRYGYPTVSIGPLLPLGPAKHAERLGFPPDWWGQTVEDVIGLRSSLLRTKVSTPIRASNPQGIQLVSQELAMAARPVDTEVVLERAPGQMRIRLGERIPPMGPSIGARRVSLAENPAVPRKVDYITSDTDVRAADAVGELYATGYSTYYLQRLLSVGLLGRGHDRRLVPTRWSITAMDDMLGRLVVADVKDSPTIDTVQVFRSSYVGNHFHILLVPRIWSFEVLETWFKGAFWSQSTKVINDYEGHRGRKSYAAQVGGAYYAARLSVLEHLHRKRRQATAIIYREITPQYWAPLGVWVIRETTKKALMGKPQTFDTLNEAVNAITAEVRIDRWWTHSALLPEIRSQRTLLEF